jgi:GT2 family glycosyltransferase
MTTVTVVTPMRNHDEFVEGWLEAVNVGAPDEVVIVDDASDPPYKTPDKLVRLDESRGFCGACNAGLAAATMDAVVFLNNDIELRAANWLRNIRRHLWPRTLVGELRRGAHTYLDGQEHPYIDGWCIAAMREDLLELGGWDETLEEPAYYSDNLLTLRALQAGWKLATPIPIGLHHLVSGTAHDDRAAIERAASANRAVWEQAVRDSTLVAT